MTKKNEYMFFLAKLKLLINLLKNHLLLFKKSFHIKHLKIKKAYLKNIFQNKNSIYF